MILNSYQITAMRPRLPVPRILILRAFRPPSRLFTQNTLPSRRPQLPFLSPIARRPLARFLTTERKRWFKDEVRRAGKYTAVLWTLIFLFLTISFGVQQEYLERKFPSPHEWSWITRWNFRTARLNEEPDDEESPVDWARTGEAYRRLIKRLENPDIEGKGLADQDEGGILVVGIGKTGFDLKNKSEPWRRGYHRVLMGAARTAEHLDGWVRDTTRNTAFPANVVIGPSNPNPRPVPPGAKSAPREEDCEPAFDAPETYYMRILTTQGFTEKQRLDAGLAYAAWLDFKGTPSAALDMYDWCLDIATSSAPNPSAILDKLTHAININAGQVSSNVLLATTSLALHHAQNNNVSAALPILLSILRARKSLPEDSSTIRTTSTEEPTGAVATILSYARAAIVAPSYPSPPNAGNLPPMRDAKEMCEEAGIMTYIGEILYASNPSTAGRERGLAWTREAVDIAEEKLRGRSLDEEAQMTCKQCLETGLGNWAKMVSRLAREEKENKSKASKVSSWLRLGGDSIYETVGRWESEEHVVSERMRRAREVLGVSKWDAPSGSSVLSA